METQQQSETITTLATALAGVSYAIPPMVGDEQGAFGPFLSLAKIKTETREAMQQYGLVILQRASSEGTNITITSTLMHPESGEWIESQFTMTPERSGPQAQGACLTYARRYTYQTLLGIAVSHGDDLDHQADHPPQTRHERPPVQPAGSGEAVTIREVARTEKPGHWVRFAITTSDNRSGSTFDEAVGEAAQTAMEAKTLVVVEMRPSKNPKYLDVVSLAPAKPATDESEEPPSLDEIPF